PRSNPRRLFACFADGMTAWLIGLVRTGTRRPSFPLNRHCQESLKLAPHRRLAEIAAQLLVPPARQYRLEHLLIRPQQPLFAQHEQPLAITARSDRGCSRV